MHGDRKKTWQEQSYYFIFIFLWLKLLLPKGGLENSHDNRTLGRFSSDDYILFEPSAFGS